MGRAYLSGFRAALRRWPVVLVLFAVNLLWGVCFTAAAWTWLSLSLDKSLATRTLLADLDVNVFIDLFTHHAEHFYTLLAAGGLLAIFLALLGVWLNAITVVAAGEKAGLAECLRRGLALYPTYFRLALLASASHAASVVAALFLGRALSRWFAESTSEMAIYWAVLPAVIMGGSLLLFFVTVHDHARVHSAATGTGALRAYAWALGFVGRNEPRALPLALLLLGSGFVAWAVYQTVGMLIATNSTSGVAASLVWGEAFVLSRMLLRVWYFAAETELQNLNELGSGGARAAAPEA